MNIKLAAVAAVVALLPVSIASANLKVLACEPEWASLSTTLGGDKVDAQSATTAFQDPHHIEARPSLIVKARRADVLFCTGAELEVVWLPLLLRKSGNPRIQPGEPGHFLAGDVVELIEQSPDADRSQGDVHAAGNPHVHWDPYRLLQIADAFSSVLQQADPANTDYYQQRFNLFTQVWHDAIRRWEQQAAAIAGTPVFVYHKNWSYLLNWLSIDTKGDLEPKPGIPPSSTHLAKLLEHTRTQPPRAILVANYQDRKGAEWLAAKSEVAVLSLPFTVGGNEAAKDLIGLYDSVIADLVKILSP